jgi:nucleotide-binding universal stress UspA family protein
MEEKRIMVCLDGSKDSIRGLRTAILFARQSDSMIVGVHIDTTQGAITAMSAPKIKEEKWSNETRKIMQIARDKAKQRGVKFEGIVIAGYKAGNDLANFANNPKSKIEQIVIAARGLGFPKETFFGSTSNFVLHKAKVPVTVVK